MSSLWGQGQGEMGAGRRAGLPEYTFFIVMFRCTVCGLGFEGGCSRKPAPYQLQYNIAAWNRICNGDKCFTLTYMSQEDGR